MSLKEGDGSRRDWFCLSPFVCVFSNQREILFTILKNYSDLSLGRDDIVGKISWKVNLIVFERLRSLLARDDIVGKISWKINLVLGLRSLLGSG